jgi:hypothetical protein
VKAFTGKTTAADPADPARMRLRSVFFLPPERAIDYSLDAALRSGAFEQRDLLTHSRFVRAAGERSTLNQDERAGRTWHPTDVARILKRDLYKRGEPKIIDPRVWNRAPTSLAGRRKR